jgi:DNA-binding transcriptional LysR family regulator
MDRLDAMTVFVAVADRRGFAPAARDLSLSPSAVTRMVAALEERLAIRLFQRTTRSVKLTDGGARYLTRARRILADVAEAEQAAQAERSEPTGRLVVAAPNLFGRLEVAPLLATLLSRYPALTGELTLADRVVNLIEEGIDAAVRIGALDDSSIVARKVGETRRVVVASPKYLARHKKPRTPSDIASHQVIQFTGMSEAPEWTFEGERFPFTPTFVTNSGDAAIGHAEHVGGLTMQLAYQVVAAVRAGRLRVVLADFEPPPLPIHVVYPTARLLSAKVRAFLDLAVDKSESSETRRWQFTEI